MVAHPSSFCGVSFIQKFEGVPAPLSRALNKGGVGKNNINISKMVGDTSKVTIND